MIAKTQKRDSWDISRVIRFNGHCSWLSSFTTGKKYFKQVHVTCDSACLMLMSTNIKSNGMHITSSLYYNMNNLPPFISRHINFLELEKNRDKIHLFGLVFRDGKLVK